MYILIQLLCNDKAHTQREQVVVKPLFNQTNIINIFSSKYKEGSLSLQSNFIKKQNSVECNLTIVPPMEMETSHMFFFFADLVLYCTSLYMS